MSFAPNIIDRARAYATAQEKYGATKEGKAAIRARKAFKRAYLGCSASDDDKSAAISELAADVLTKLQSYVYKHERNLLQLDEAGSTTIPLFITAATTYGMALLNAQKTPECEVLRRTKEALRAAVIQEMKTCPLDRLQQRFERQNIQAPRVYSRLQSWYAQYGEQP